MNEGQTAILIQARSRSTRLPEKCFLRLPQSGPAMIDRVYTQNRQSGLPVYFVIPEADPTLEEYLKTREYPYLCGPEQDVRERYRKASRQLGLSLIIRSTADNPFVDSEHIRLALDRMDQLQCDLFAFSDMPLGTGVEVFTDRALFEDTDPVLDTHREHVSLHIKHHPDRFMVVHEPSPVVAVWRKQNSYSGDLPRLTIDEKVDYETLARVAESLNSEPDAQIGMLALLDLFRSEPELFSGNRDVEQRRFERN